MMFPDSKVVVALLSNAPARSGEPEARTIGHMFIR
jgi:hypothetical protein